MENYKKQCCIRETELDHMRQVAQSRNENGKSPLSGSAQALYLSLWFWADYNTGELWASQKTMANMLGWNKTKVWRAYSQLKELGLIQQVESGGFGKPSRTFVVALNKQNDDSPVFRKTRFSNSDIEENDQSKCDPEVTLSDEQPSSVPVEETPCSDRRNHSVPIDETTVFRKTKPQCSDRAGTNSPMNTPGELPNKTPQQNTPEVEQDNDYPEDEVGDEDYTDKEDSSLVGQTKEPVEVLDEPLPVDSYKEEPSSPFVGNNNITPIGDPNPHQSTGSLSDVILGNDIDAISPMNKVHTRIAIKKLMQHSQKTNLDIFTLLGKLISGEYMKPIDNRGISHANAVIEELPSLYGQAYKLIQQMYKDYPDLGEIHKNNQELLRTGR